MERHQSLAIPPAASVPAMPSAAHDAEHVVKEYMDACIEHKWLIVLSGLCLAVVVGAWSMLQTPVYQARATVVIESQGPGWLDKDKSHYLDNTPEYFQTHFELLRSHYVLQGAARLLDLANRPEYQPQPSVLKNLVASVVPQSIREFWPFKETKQPMTPEAAEEGLLKSFSGNVEIMPIRGARLAHITVSSTDSQFAAKAANTLVSVYIARNQELSSSATEQAARWFTTHLEELRQKVQSAQEALYTFRAKHGLHSGEERKTLAGHTLAELESQLVKSEMAKAEAQSRFEQIKALLNPRGKDGGNVDWSKLDSLTQVLNSHLIQTLRAQEITVSAQVAELSEKYGPLHPKLAHVKAELQDLRQRIQQEIQKIYDSVKHEYNMAVAHDRAVEEAIARFNADKIRMEHTEIEHSMLEREAESSQHLYDMFLKATKEADMSAGMRTNNVYLADPATASTTPAKPKTKLNVMLAMIAGLMSGVGLAIYLESRGKKLRAPADLERYIPNVSVLGVVPLIPKAGTPEKALVHPHAQTPAAESYRIIRTSLMSRPESLPYRVLITSPGENEGKTTLSVNLAMAMAQLEDTKVVLVDADFRNQTNHPIYDVGTKTSAPMGLAQFLRGEALLSEVVHKAFFPNLSVIPSGGRPNNPTELLYSGALTQLLNWSLENRYHLIFDCPPVLPIADAAVLAPRVDGVLMVVSAGETTREACRLAIQRMTFSGGKVLGIVMQKARMTDSPYFYNYYGSHQGQT